MKEQNKREYARIYNLIRKKQINKLNKQNKN